MNDIWVASVDGSDQLQLTRQVGFSGSLRWSSDGRFIVFDLHIPETGEVDIYMVEASGGPFRVRSLISGPVSSARIDVVVIFSNDSFLKDPLTPESGEVLGESISLILPEGLQRVAARRAPDGACAVPSPPHKIVAV
jgi:Tol biopolymer transport system component